MEIGRPATSDDHTIQYALVGSRGAFVPHTEDLTDDEVRGRLSFMANNGDAVERYDRCSICEVWTKTRGKLRPESECPAVREAIAKA
jgi:hypothetical protein